MNCQIFITNKQEIEWFILCKSERNWNFQYCEARRLIVIWVKKKKRRSVSANRYKALQGTSKEEEKKKRWNTIDDTLLLNLYWVLFDNIQYTFHDTRRLQLYYMKKKSGHDVNWDTSPALILHSYMRILFGTLQVAGSFKKKAKQEHEQAKAQESKKNQRKFNENQRKPNFSFENQW